MRRPVMLRDTKGRKYPFVRSERSTSKRLTNEKLAIFLQERYKMLYGDDSLPLHRATDEGHLEVVRFLADPELFPHSANAQDYFGVTPLYWAADKGHLEVVRYLADPERFPHSANSQAKNGDTPWHRAAGKSHLEVVRYLADPERFPHSTNAQAKNGYTPLHRANAYGKVYS
eukprot:g55975.t1